MTDDPHPAPPPTKPPPKVRDETDNTVLKWAAGAVAAVVLLGGGYYVVSNLPSNDPGAQVAETDAAFDSAGPVDPIGAAPPMAPVADVSPDAAAPKTTAKSAASRSRTQTASTDSAIPEAVIGVGPADVVNVSDSGDEIVVTPGRRPVWSRTPSAKRLSALYPARALERGREGEASVRCTVQDAAGVLACERVSESPANAGFGNAALRVARTFRHAPQRADGSPAVGTPVNLRVLFRVADEDRRG